jgi:uncharacterized Zn finger protein (UPF0148 family)
MIKCAKCKKEFESDGFKCCPSCRATQKQKRKAEYAKQKQVKNKEKETSERQLEEIKFQVNQQKKDEENRARRIELVRKKWEIDRFINPQIHPFTDQRKCPEYRRTILKGMPMMRSLSEHYSECESCQDWEYELRNGTLQDEDGNLYKNIKEIDMEIASEDCLIFRKMYAHEEARTEGYAFLYDQHLPSCELCKIWKLKFDEANQDQSWKESGQPMGENAQGFVDMTSENDKDILRSLGHKEEEKKNPNRELIDQQRNLGFGYERQQNVEQQQPSEPTPEPQPQENQKRKSDNPDPDEWMQSHSG